MRNLFLFCCLVHSFTAYSQSPEIPGRIVVNRIYEKISLDGKLDEQAWNSVPQYSDFMQSNPNPGGTPTEITSFSIMHDDDYFYVGIRAFDKEADKIVGSGFQRDSYNTFEDGVQLFIDMYNDKFNAIGLFANVLDAKQDGEIVGNENKYNGSFNTFWEVKTHISKEGYTMEFQIPFSSLRFKESDKVVMGFKVLRQIGRKNEILIFPKSDPTLSNLSWRISNETEIEFSKLKTKKPIYITPYIKADYWKQNTSKGIYTQFMQRNDFFKNAFLDKTVSNMGVDIKLGVTKNFTLEASLNTDFAQVEVDNRVVNLTRFGINLPEKRLFFLEANDFLNLNMGSENVLLFNSRNIGIEKGKIVPIVGGVKLTGKANGLQVGFLNMQTNGLSEEAIGSKNFSVLRLKKDLFKNGSNVGAFYANQYGKNDYSLNQTIGVDYNHRINDYWSYGTSLATTKDNNAGWFNNENNAFNFFLLKNKFIGWKQNISANIINQNFNPRAGFVYDKAFKDVLIGQTYAWKLKSRKLNTLSITGEVYTKWRDSDETYLENNRYLANVRLIYKNGSLLRWRSALFSDLLKKDWFFGESILIAPKKYQMHTHEIVWTSAYSKKYAVEFNPLIGTFYGGKRLTINTKFTNTFSKHFTAGINYNFSTIRFPNITFNNHLISTNLLYSLDTKISASLLGQYDNTSKKISLNVRFRYNPKEGTDLYVVYNPLLNSTIFDRQNPTPAFDNQQIIIKYSKAINI